MSETCGYLVPDKSFEIGEFKKQVKTILDGLGVTKGFYDQAKGTLAAGPHSFLICSENPNNSAIAFEYADIHDSNNKRLLPESFDAGANCNKCKENIDEFFLDALSDLYEQEYDNAIETDMAQLEMVCENCGYINGISEVIFDHDVAINNQYFQFIAIEADFNMVAVEEIGKRLGCNLKVFYDRF